MKKIIILITLLSLTIFLIAAFKDCSPTAQNLCLARCEESFGKSLEPGYKITGKIVDVDKNKRYLQCDCYKVRSDCKVCKQLSIEEKNEKILVGSINVWWIW